MIKLYTSFILVACCLGSTAQAQTGDISGAVFNADSSITNEVSIKLLPANKQLVSRDGTFAFKQIPTGKYTLVARDKEQHTATVNITVTQGTQSVNLYLSSGITELDEIEITSSQTTYVDTLPSSSLRIQTPLLETAQNIQIVTKSTLSDQQAYDMLDAVQRNVSGAQRVEHWDNYARINMRGSQLTAFRNGMNVQLSPWSPLTEDMSMVERIEFIKGPAGFMLGNGEPSGFYNVVTKKPTGMQRGEIGFAFGSFNFYRFTTDLDGKLSKNGKWLYRLNVMGQLKGSHRDFEYNNRYTIAPVIKYQMNEKSSLTFEYNEQYSQVNVIGSNYAFSKKGMADLPISFTTAEANLDPTVMRDRTFLALFEHQINSRWKLTAQGSFMHYKQIGQSIWPWGMSSTNDSMMQRGISIWDALGYNRNGQLFVNGKFLTGAIQHTFLGGIDMSYRDYWADWNQGAALGDSTFNIYNPQYGTVAASSIPEWDRSKDIRVRGVQYTNGYTSFYAQDELAFFQNKFRLTLAARYTNITMVNPYSGTYTKGKVTPRAGLSWTILKDLATYVVYDQAFVANPGMDWEGNSFDPITGSNIEWGMKKDWFKKRWNSTISLYRMVKNNILTTDLEHPDPISGQFLYSVQTGEQLIQGVEVDLRGTILPGLQLVINYAYTDAHITKDANPAIVGNRTAGATKHIQNTWLTYQIQKSALKGLRFQLGYQFQGDRSSWFVFDNTENTLPNYFRLDAGIGYQTGKIGINLMINNVTDAYLYSGAPSGTLYYWQTEAGRNFRLSLNYTF